MRGMAGNAVSGATTTNGLARHFRDSLRMIFSRLLLFQNDARNRSTVPLKKSKTARTQVVMIDLAVVGGGKQIFSLG
jgi:hypothetical protein